MKKLISGAVSVGILLIIYWKIDTAAMLQAFGGCRMGLLAGGMALLLPITLLMAGRLQILMPKEGRLPFGESVSLTLSAGVLNIVLPSKMGDLAKAYFMKDRGHVNGALALSLVVFERACDVLSLLAWCIVGLLMCANKDRLLWTIAGFVALGIVCGLLILGSRRAAGLFFGLARRALPSKLACRFEGLASAWSQMQDYFWQDRQRLIAVSVLSISIWFVHLLQIWVFILALNVQNVGLLTSMGLTPLALLVGLLPLTIAGVGTRDAALIYFYQPYFGAATGAALGLLCTLRCVVWAVCGLPTLGRCLSQTRTNQGEAAVERSTPGGSG